MPFVNFKNMLRKAREGGYAIGAFDVSNYEMIRAVVEVAEELRSPVILSALRVDLEDSGMDYIASMAKVADEQTSVPICLHLDHAEEIGFIKKAIDKGFSSVMIDRSQEEFRENIDATREVCDYAHKRDVTVEAELGHVPDALTGESTVSESTGSEDPQEFLTQPSMVEQFVDATEVDALAIAFGTAHGVYLEEPNLDISLLSSINEISNVPLVMHGGSGVSEEDIQDSIEAGISKINIYSEVLNSFFTALRSKLNNIDNMSTWPSEVYEEPIKSMKKLVREKIRLFGSVKQTY